jgi:hypothetical protein
VAILLFSAVALVAPASRAGDPTMADCIRANEQSIELRRSDRLREAREQLLVCAARTCPGEIRAQCEQHLIDVNASIPTIVFEAKDPAGNDFSTVTVSMDGKPLASRLEGTAISLDPGPHSFHFESPGLPPIDKSFVLHQGEKERRERIPFATSTRVAGAPTTVTPDGREAASAPSSSLRTIGLVTGAAGLVGIGVGTVFGLKATSDKSDAACDANGYCASGPLGDARSHANVATVGFVVGGLLLAAGVALVVFAPSGSNARVEVAPAVAERSGGAVVGGVF